MQCDNRAEAKEPSLYELREKYLDKVVPAMSIIKKPCISCKRLGQRFDSRVKVGLVNNTPYIPLTLHR